MAIVDLVKGKRFSEDEGAAIKRLVPYAYEKLFVAQLLINGYNCRTATVDMSSLMQYTANEPPKSTLKQDVYTLLEVMARGIETHEILGEKTLHNLIDRYTKKALHSGY